MVIKVQRADLIRAIGARIRDLNDKSKREQVAYAVAVERAKVNLPKQLRAMAKIVEGGDFRKLEQYTSCIHVKINGELPEKPHIPGEICRLKGDLSRLQLSKEPVISLRDDDRMLAFLDGDACKR